MDRIVTVGVGRTVHGTTVTYDDTMKPNGVIPVAMEATILPANFLFSTIVRRLYRGRRY